MHLLIQNSKFFICDQASGKKMHFNPISSGLFYLVVARGEGVFSTPSLKLDPDIREH